MKAAIISLGSISSKWTIDALKEYFTTVDHINIEDLEVSLGQKQAQVLYKGKPLPKYDCIYAKGSYKYATMLRAITTLLGKETYMPLRPATYTIGHDKVLTHLKFQEYNVPQPTTYLASTAEAGKKIIKKIPFPIIMKLPAGTHGKGVMLADSPESASSMMDALSVLKQPFLIQEYVETEGQDCRVIVVGNKIAAAMKRKAARGEKRANIHAGGSGEKIELNEKTQDAAILAAKSTGCDICAVDILPSSKGPLVLEVNLSPGLQGITKVTKTNVAKIIAEYLYEKAKDFKETLKQEIIREAETEQEIQTTADYKGNKIILPEAITTASRIKEGQKVTMKAKKGHIEITKN